MNVETINNSLLNMQLKKIKHSSGLTVLLAPMTDYHSTYAVFGTDYGSVDTTFKTENENNFTEVPPGIAHFLEHKLFENEDKDAFERYAKTGASANAFTSFDKTCYLFSCTENFGDSLRILLDFVTSPFFTDETVKKEQGIIGQEIKMYDDSPGWQVFFRLLGALYHNNPVKIDIAGTVESISEITPELLHRCYSTFYNLNNMVLCIAGNFNEKEVIEICGEMLKPAVPMKIQREEVNEPGDVAKSEVVTFLPVAQPLFSIGFKETPPSADQRLKTEIEMECLLEAAVGQCSELFDNLYEEGLINLEFSHEILLGKGYFAAIISGESCDPASVRQRIIDRIQNMKQNGISDEEFKLAKRSLIGRYISGFNSVENIGNAMVGAYFEENNVFSPVEELYALTKQQLEKRLKTALNENCCALSVVKNNEGDNTK